MRLRGCNPNACYPVASPIAHSFAGFWTFLLLTARLKVRLITACRQYLPQLVLLVFLRTCLTSIFSSVLPPTQTQTPCIAALPTAWQQPFLLRSLSPAYGG